MIKIIGSFWLAVFSQLKTVKKDTGQKK